MSVLDSYSRQAHGVPKGASQFTKLDAIPDGRYQFAIKSVALNEPTQGVVYAMKLAVLDGVSAGLEIDYDNWLVGDNAKSGQRELKARAVGRLKEEIEVLGIDPSLWGEFDFWAEFRKAMPSLVGRRFSGLKSSRRSGQQTYHDLKFEARLPDAATADAATADAPPASSGEPIPF